MPEEKSSSGLYAAKGDIKGRHTDNPDFTAARDNGVAVASARPYANHLHLAPDR